MENERKTIAIRTMKKVTQNNSKRQNFPVNDFLVFLVCLFFNLDFMRAIFSFGKNHRIKHGSKNVWMMTDRRFSNQKHCSISGGKQELLLKIKKKSQ
jgi:hypothetical protein